MTFAAAWIRNSGPLTLVPMCASNSASPTCASGVWPMSPALRTRMSGTPSRRTHSLSSARPPAGVDTSARTTKARPPSRALMKYAVRSASAAVRWKLTTTSAPSAASRLAMEAPIEREEPVMRATLPARGRGSRGESKTGGWVLELGLELAMLAAEGEAMRATIILDRAGECVKYTGTGGTPLVFSCPGERAARR